MFINEGQKSGHSKKSIKNRKNGFFFLKMKISCWKFQEGFLMGTEIYCPKEFHSNPYLVQLRTFSCLGQKDELWGTQYVHFKKGSMQMIQKCLLQAPIIKRSTFVLIWSREWIPKLSFFQVAKPKDFIKLIEYFDRMSKLNQKLHILFYT